jgi:hypothetical protein
MEESNRTENLYSKNIRLKDKINNLYNEVKDNIATEDEMITFINDFTDNLSKLFYIIDNTLAESSIVNPFYYADPVVSNENKGFRMYYYNKCLTEILFGKLNFTKLHIFSVAIYRNADKYFLEIRQDKRPGHKEEDKRFFIMEGDKYEKADSNIDLRTVYDILNTTYTKLSVEADLKIIELKNNKQKGNS